MVVKLLTAFSRCEEKRSISFLKVNNSSFRVEIYLHLSTDAAVYHLFIPSLIIIRFFVKVTNE